MGALGQGRGAGSHGRGGAGDDREEEGQETHRALAQARAGAVHTDNLVGAGLSGIADVGLAFKFKLERSYFKFNVRLTCSTFRSY